MCTESISIPNFKSHDRVIVIKTEISGIVVKSYIKIHTTTTTQFFPEIKYTHWGKENNVQQMVTLGSYM